MECRADDRCYAPGAAAIDAPLPLDAAVDVPPPDVPPPDAPPPDVRIFVDARECVDGAARCGPGAPSVRQVCSDATGLWMDVETCDVSLGCYDADGADGPQAYCGVCANGDKRCNGGLQTCAGGLWPAPVACTGGSCFDPAPAGGSDAYCGVCLKGDIVCHGDNRDQCNADGQGYTTLAACMWGCDPAASATCCAAPGCGGAVCGLSSPNACGKTQSCGPCTGICCDQGLVCCGLSQTCCGETCCGQGEICCEPNI